MNNDLKYMNEIILSRNRYLEKRLKKVCCENQVLKHEIIILKKLINEVK